MIGNDHHVSLIEDAVIFVGRENLRDQRIGYRLEVVNFHRQRIVGDMGVQIDSRKIDDLDLRNAVLRDRFEQLGHRILVHLLVDVGFPRRSLAAAFCDEFRVQFDHRERVDGREVVGAAIDRVQRDRRFHSRLLKQRRALELLADQPVGDHRAVVVHLRDRHRRRCVKSHLLAREPFVARHRIPGRGRAGENSRPGGDGGRGQDGDGVGHGVSVLVQSAALGRAKHRGHRRCFARVKRFHQLVIADAVKGEDQNVGTRLLRSKMMLDLLFAAVEQEFD